MYQGCSISTVFKPTDVVLSGTKEECDEFFAVIGAKTSECIISNAELSPDSMSPAFESKVSMRDYSGMAYIFSQNVDLAKGNCVYNHDLKSDTRNIAS